MMSDLGTVDKQGDNYVLRYERHLAHPIDKVWSALTKPEEIAGWLAEATVDPVVGGKIELRWLNTDEHGNSAEARGVITALEPPNLLEYDTDIHGRLRWELAEQSGGTTLTFTVVAPLPDEFKLKVVAGWHVHLDHLESVLAGQAIDWPRWWEKHGPDWEKIRDRYAAAGE